MKTLLRSLAGILIVACVGCLGCADVGGSQSSSVPPGLVGSGFEKGDAITIQPGPQLSNVSFALGRSDFDRGDAIVIQQVLATSPSLNVGDTVVVRGRYNLASKPDARLALYVTGVGGGGRTRTSPGQTVKVTNGSGEFELTCEISYAGDLHVSFYPSAGGSSFGGVYFALRGR